MMVSEQARAGRVWAILLGITLVLTFAAVSAFGQSARFSRIDVEGNQRIEADTIRVIAGIEPGQTVDAADINGGLQRLFDSGLFDDVTLTPEGGRLVIAVSENPTINFINFEGNDLLTDEVLLQVITLRERRAFSRAAAEADAQAIVDVYAQAGRFNAEVTPVIIRLPDNRVNLAFEIVEGRVTEVQRISFTGNRAYSDRRLRRAIETGQAGPLSSLFTADNFDEARLELDQQLLREFYLNRGYVDFEVISATASLARERNGFFVNFTVFEGEQYRYGDISVTVLAEGLDPMAFDEELVLRPGQVYNAEQVDRQIERLAFLAGQQGFAFVDVQPRLDRNPDDLTVSIDFELIEGPRVFVERIDIRGNTQTLDRVIRRQFNTIEGDAFNTREIARAEDRIRALRYFSDVSVGVREGSAPDRAVISVDLEEAPTGNIQFGAAFSSSDGVTGTISLDERNFLGRGQNVGIALSAGADVRNYSFSFTEPALFDRDLAAGFEVYSRRREREESGITTENTGFEPRVSFPLTEDSRLTLRYRISQDSIVGADPDEVSPVLVAEEDELVTSAVGFTYLLDRRNSPVDPTGGFILRFDQDFAGVGGDTQFAKSRALVRGFRSFLGEDLVLSAEVEGGVLTMFDGNSRITDRFILGGDLLRGFRRGGIGPRDRCNNCLAGNDVDDALAGNLFAVARFEASFPIGVPEQYGIFGGLFFDVGTVWGLDDVVDGASGPIDDSAKLRSSVGASIFWDTAIGPLRLNYAIPLESVAGDEEERFRLTVDTRF